MKRGRASLPLREIGVALILTAFAGNPAAAATRESLACLKLSETTITATQSIPAGTYTAPDGEVFANMPAFCRAAATLTPTSDSDIGIEVWMPSTTWNGRFEGVVRLRLACHLGTPPLALTPATLGPRPMMDRSRSDTRKKSSVLDIARSI